MNMVTGEVRLNHNTAVSTRLLQGFRGQILFVIPRNMLQELAAHPLLHSLLATDIGWYPEARYHYCERPEGAAEHILIYCAAGVGWYEVGGQRQTLEAHEAVILPAISKLLWLICALRGALCACAPGIGQRALFTRFGGGFPALALTDLLLRDGFFGMTRQWPSPRGMMPMKASVSASS